MEKEACFLHMIRGMSKILLWLIMLVMVGMLPVVWAVRVDAEIDSLGAVEADVDEIAMQRLSQKARGDLTALEKAENRQRPVVVNRAEVLQMLAAGFPEDVIRLLIGLDWVTGREERIPITPAQVRALTAFGVSFETIRVMLASESAQAAGRKNGQDSTAPVPETSPGGPDVAREGEVYQGPSDGQSRRLGRQVITYPDGRQVVVYASPFGEGHSELGQEEVLGPDGNKSIVYYSQSKDNTQEILDERARQDYRKAMDLLERLRLEIEITE
jgi:hypothetical protein